MKERRNRQVLHIRGSSSSPPAPERPELRPCPSLRGLCRLALGSAPGWDTGTQACISALPPATPPLSLLHASRRCPPLCPAQLSPTTHTHTHTHTQTHTPLFLCWPLCQLDTLFSLRFCPSFHPRLSQASRPSLSRCCSLSFRITSVLIPAQASLCPTSLWDDGASFLPQRVGGCVRAWLLGPHWPSYSEPIHTLVKPTWGFPGSSVLRSLLASAGDVGSISVSRRSPGGGNGNPLQYSCLGNPMDRGAWQATIHRVTRVSCLVSN